MGTYHVFQATSGTGVAITDDRSGAKLPKRQLGSWVYQKQVVLNVGSKGVIGGSADDVIAGIERDGYCLWPKPKPEN